MVDKQFENCSDAFLVSTAVEPVDGSLHGLLPLSWVELFLHVDSER